jgi:chromosomal replication initiation ATPase DnaA
MIDADDVQDRLHRAVNEILRQLRKGGSSVDELFRQVAEKYDVTVEQLATAWRNTDFVGRTDTPRRKPKWHL